MRQGDEAESTCGLICGSKLEKEYAKAPILSPYLFNLHAGYIIQDARLDEAQAGIEIAGRNTNNFIYENDTTLKAESKEELNSLLMKVKKESEKN